MLSVRGKFQKITDGRVHETDENKTNFGQLMVYCPFSAELSVLRRFLVS
jgi:hypothetical protein